MIPILATIAPADLAIVIAYIVGITALGCYAGMRKKARKTVRRNTSSRAVI